VGCGRGELAERIALEVGAEVVAVDQSERMVELARERVDARVGDVQELAFDDGSFDCAVAAWMLRAHPFNAENGANRLARHFVRVERRVARGTVTFADWDAARRYVANSFSRRELADELPRFDGPLLCSRLTVVFVAETAA
jgi:ubiquinone/menaquinone biosynthesis C-methylase UbiE